MNNQYRLKLVNQEIKGPVELTGIKDLVDEVKIEDIELIQVYPDGKWKKPYYFSEVIDQINNSKEILEEQTLINQVQDDTESNSTPDDQDDNSVNDVEESENGFVEMTKTMEIEPINDSEVKKAQEKLVNTTNETEGSENKEDIEQEDNQDKTIIRPDTINYLEELKKQQEAQKIIDEENRKKEEELQRAKELEENLTSESTQMFSIDNLRNELDRLKEDEKSLEKEEQLEKEKRQKALEKELEEDEDDEDEEDEEELKNKKKKIIYIAIALALAIILFMPEEKEVKKQTYKSVHAKILFPVPYDSINEVKSNEYYESALKDYAKHTYLGLVNSSRKLLKAVEINYKNKNALAKLMLIYGELIKFSKQRKKDSQTLFKFLQVNEAKFLDNVDYVTSLALFFYSNNKFTTSVKEIRKYLDLKNKPTMRLYSVLLLALYNSGEFEKAQKVFLSLNKVKDIYNQFVFEAMIEYQFKLNEYDEAAEIIARALKNIPSSVPILLKKAELLLYKEDYIALVNVLKKIKEANFEFSPIYRSIYLLYYGKFYLAQKKTKEAKKFFKEALEESDEFYIRTELASLSVEKIPEAKELILESKALEYMDKSKNALQFYDWKRAISAAVNAVDIAPNYLPAKIHLAKIQIKQGNYEKAIANLRQIHSKYPTNKEANFTLLEAYIEAYKFTQAKNLLASIGASDLRKDYLFYSYQGRMYAKMGVTIEAINWLQSSINENPVNDKDYHLLAMQFFKKKLFKRCKLMLSKAIELAPTNSLYRVEYSKVLYEESGVDAAIGYLRDLLNDFPYDSYILGEIAINYFRSGNINKFNELKKQLKQLPDNKDYFYRFLMESALLEEDFDKVIEYGNELLLAKPGDLKTRMLLGEIYLEKGTTKGFEKALEYFISVKKRLSTYPKLSLSLSRLKKYIGEIDDAIKYAKEEIQNNPEILDSYTELGKLYIKKEDWIQAEKFFQRAQQIKPNALEALIGLAQISFKKNQLDVALELYQKAVKTAPSDARLRKLIGDVYRQMGQSALAIKSYQVHLELDPDSKYSNEINTYIRNFQ